MDFLISAIILFLYSEFLCQQLNGHKGECINSLWHAVDDLFLLFHLEVTECLIILLYHLHEILISPSLSACIRNWYTTHNWVITTWVLYVIMELFVWESKFLEQVICMFTTACQEVAGSFNILIISSGHRSDLKSSDPLFRSLNV